MEAKCVSSDSEMLCSKDVKLKVNSEEAHGDSRKVQNVTESKTIPQLKRENINFLKEMCVERLKKNLGRIEDHKKRSPENKLETHLHKFNRRHVPSTTRFALISQSMKEKNQLIEKKSALFSQSIKEKNQLMKKKFALISQSLKEKNRLMQLERQQRVLARIKAWKKSSLSVTDSNVEPEKSRVMKTANESTQASKICILRDILKSKMQCARLKVQMEQEAKKIIKDRLVQCARIKAREEQEAKNIIQDRLMKYARIKAQKEREAKKIKLSNSEKDRVKINKLENDSSSLKVSEEQPCSSKKTQPTMLLVNNTEQFLFVHFHPYQKEPFKLIPVEKIKDMNNAGQPSQLPAVIVNTEPLDNETSCQTLALPPILELVVEQDQPDKDLLTYIKEEIKPLLTCTQDNEQYYPVKVKEEPMEGE